ncbi:MAG: glutamate 5-kinase [Alphaproteobacteria bacterium]|nr:glutamate 5-kinase [Alphaproteobacteria bacterium]
MQYDFSRARRIVIKIGSATLVDRRTGLRRGWLASLAEDIVALRAAGAQVVIVSSGAVALGAPLLGPDFSRARLADSQAAAAVGQIRLAHAYQETMARHAITVAQILLTLDDTEVRRRYLNARDTIEALVRLGALPVINENDTVATNELRYGDNDRLAARVAQMISADCLVILSDVDGLYSADPTEDPAATLFTHIPRITPEIEAVAGGARSDGVGRGGMATKMAAAKIAVPSGCHVLILNGGPAHPIGRYRDTGTGTWFEAHETPLTVRKQWIAGALKPTAVITVDGGAAQALRQGKSLLAAGVSGVRGTFDRGDTVTVQGEDGRELARGLIAYSSDEARRIMGRRSGDIEELLGYKGRGPVIHRDHLVLL